MRFKFSGNCSFPEVYRECSSHCEQTCSNPNPLCIASCAPPKCECPYGYVRNDGTCIPVHDCEGLQFFCIFILIWPPNLSLIFIQNSNVNSLEFLEHAQAHVKKPALTQRQFVWRFVAHRSASVQMDTSVKAKTIPRAYLSKNVQVISLLLHKSNLANSSESVIDVILA